MVVDPSPEKIQDISNQVAQAVVADGTRKKQLQSLPLSKVDSVICCIGEDLQASLLTVLNLKELGVKHIIAKSSSPAHTIILEKLGVADIFHPERDMAISLAERLNWLKDLKISTSPARSKILLAQLQSISRKVVLGQMNLPPRMSVA